MARRRALHAAPRAVHGDRGGGGSLVSHPPALPSARAPLSHALITDRTTVSCDPTASTDAFSLPACTQVSCGVIDTIARLI